MDRAERRWVGFLTALAALVILGFLLSYQMFPR